MSAKRFRIAFSFAGEKRDFVQEVGGLLAARFGQEKILYDNYHEAEFARYDLGLYLPTLYGEQSDLVVPVLCPNYDVKRWTGWEWVHIYGLLTKADGARVMPSRFDYAHAGGSTKDSPRTTTRSPPQSPHLSQQLPFPTICRRCSRSSDARRSYRRSPTPSTQTLVPGAR